MIDVKHRELLPPAVADEFDSLVASLRQYLYTEDQDPSDTLEDVVTTVVQNEFITQIANVGGTLASLTHYNRSATFTANGDTDDLAINSVDPSRSVVIPTLIGDYDHTVGIVGFVDATHVRFTMTAGLSSPVTLATNFWVVEFNGPGTSGPATALNLDDLTDVVITPNPPTSGDALVYDGASWVNNQLHLRGTRAAQPVATAVPPGTLYFVTDSQDNVTERSNGTAWQSYSTAVTTAGKTNISITGTYESGLQSSLHGALTVFKGAANAAQEFSTAVANASASERAALFFLKSRGTVGSETAVVSADSTGAIGFKGYDGSNMLLTALLVGRVDAAVSSGTVPGSFEFLTGPTVAGRAIRAIIGSNGLITIGAAQSASYPALKQSSAELHARLADDTDFATFKCKNLVASGTITGTIARTDRMTFVVDGGGSVLPTGRIAGAWRAPSAGTITKVTLLSSDGAATAGSVTIDLWKDTFANYPPVVGDSMVGAGTKPSLSTATASEVSSFGTWTTAAFSAGDVIVANIATVTSLLHLTIIVEVLY